ncbi:MAG: hypothetical protein VX000_03195, partial [Myxococcota bacterium]|nr:hypothetical protein [Myxococcota bacterium]
MSEEKDETVQDSAEAIAPAVEATPEAAATEAASAAEADSDTPTTDDGDDAPVGNTRLVTDYISDRAFADFPLAPEVLKGIEEKGYTVATGVQAATIEPALAGRDLVVR